MHRSILGAWGKDFFSGHSVIPSSGWRSRYQLAAQEGFQKRLYSLDLTMRASSSVHWAPGLASTVARLRRGRRDNRPMVLNVRSAENSFIKVWQNGTSVSRNLLWILLTDLDCTLGEWMRCWDNVWTNNTFAIHQNRIEREQTAVYQYQYMIHVRSKVQSKYYSLQFQHPHIIQLSKLLKLQYG